MSLFIAFYLFSQSFQINVVEILSFQIMRLLWTINVVLYKKNNDSDNNDDYNDTNNNLRHIRLKANVRLALVQNEIA